MNYVKMFLNFINSRFNFNSRKNVHRVGKLSILKLCHDYANGFTQFFDDTKY